MPKDGTRIVIGRIWLKGKALGLHLPPDIDLRTIQRIRKLLRLWVKVNRLHKPPELPF